MPRKPKEKKNVLKLPHSKSNSASSHTVKLKHWFFFTGILLLLFSALLLISFLSFLPDWKREEYLFEHGLWEALRAEERTSNWAGTIGGWLAYIFIKRWFGVASFLFIPVFFLIGLRLVGIQVKQITKIIIFCLLWLFYLSTLFGTLFHSGSATILGGTIGFQTSELFIQLLGKFGNLLFLLTLFFVLLYFTSKTLFFRFIQGARKTGELVIDTASRVSLPGKKEACKTENKEHICLDQAEEKTLSVSSNTSTDTTETDQFSVPIEIIHTEKDTVFVDHDTVDTGHVEDLLDTENEFDGDDIIFDPVKELHDYQFPVVDLLQEYGQDSIVIDKKEVELNKQHIEQTLLHYGITINKIYATVGPTVTLYEIVPSPGIRISKIKNLEDDIALSLAALGIRIIAPIPGKGTIGIEVPNKHPKIVSFRSIVLSEEFQKTTFELPLALGKTIDNRPFIVDLTKMPHILMAGATGQGKSVGLNTIIASLLYKKHPAELKFVLVDPKKVELPLYAQIEKHFLAKLPDAQEAIITDTSQVVRTLKGLIMVMEQRYELLKQAHVRHILEYNRKFLSRKLNPLKGHHFMPYIVLIIDEFADLIMTAGREIEGPIARLAQLARAVGIHLIIATQRPSVNIITGIIKANFPARMAFRVSAKVDSRTILDTGGAEQLIGRGDMLFSSGGHLERVQCAYIDTEELERIAQFIGSQPGYPSAFELPDVPDDTEEKVPKEFSSEERDPLFEEAARIIVQSQHGSTSLLQRKLKLGYNRAGRLIDQLEAAGIVGPFEGSKAREVLIKDMETLEQLLQKLQ